MLDHRGHLRSRSSPRARRRSSLQPPPIADVALIRRRRSKPWPRTISRLIEDAIPLEYDKQKDWGATTRDPRRHAHRRERLPRTLDKRKRTVNHGVWKHYKLRLIEPEQNLAVELADLRPIAPGRVAFTLHSRRQARRLGAGKVYQYGVHLIALEMESDMRVRARDRRRIGDRDCAQSTTATASPSCPS